MTLEQQIARARQTMKNAAMYRRNDGALLLFLKLICRPFVLWHAHVLLNILPAYAACARWLFEKFVNPVNEKRDGDALLHLSVDCFTITALIVSSICYLVTFAVVTGIPPCPVQSICVALMAVVPICRCYGIFAFLALLHSETGYKPNSLVRALVNTMCHYIEVVIAFGVFYLACGYFSNDTFSSSQGSELTSDLSNSVYFSFVTITTLGYGDLAPQLWPGKLLVVAEVGFGLFLLVIVLQRAMSAGQRPSVDAVLGELDQRSLAFIYQMRQVQPSFPRPTLATTEADDGVERSEASIDHCLSRLTALGILRFDVALQEGAYAYHWTELGNEIIARLPPIEQPPEATTETQI